MSIFAQNVAKVIVLMMEKNEILEKDRKIFAQNFAGEIIVGMNQIMSQIDKCFKYFTSQPDRGPEPRWSVVEERHQPVYRSDQVSISKTYS